MCLLTYISKYIDDCAFYYAAIIIQPGCKSNQKLIRHPQYILKGVIFMAFILEQLQMFGTVALVMVCAAVGTAGILKLIKRFTPGDGFPKDPVSKKLENQQGKEE